MEGDWPYNDQVPFYTWGSGSQLVVQNVKAKEYFGGNSQLNGSMKKLCLGLQKVTFTKQERQVTIFSHCIAPGVKDGFFDQGDQYLLKLSKAQIALFIKGI